MTWKKSLLLDLCVCLLALIVGFTLGNMGRLDSVSAVQQAVKEVRVQSQRLEQRITELTEKTKEEVRRNREKTKREIRALNSSDVADALRQLLRDARRDDNRH